MSHFFQDLTLELDDELSTKISELVPNYSDYRILKKSVDARRGHPPRFIYSIEVAGQNENLPNLTHEDFKDLSSSSSKSNLKDKPIIIGAGPAGLFCALRLVERGIPCLLLERGSVAEKRIHGINKYWRYGQLDPRNNVCFGEGGAGLYSDGKLITRIKSPHIPYVLHKLVQFGAPAEIEFLANPHVGSDKLRRVIPFLREYLISHGCEIHFDTQVTDFITSNTNQIIGVRTEYNQTLYSNHVVIATGHSADDIFQLLQKHNVQLEGKSFAVGLRIEHPQKLINNIQYREFATHPKLESANYKLTYHNKKENVGVYSFCMCPGGYVLSSGTEADGIVCNGMSNFKRNSPYANSALVTTIDHQQFFGTDIFGGLKFRRQLEQKAFQWVQKTGGTKQLPTQKLTDFLNKKKSTELLSGSSPSGTISINLHELLNNFMYEKILEGLEHFNKNMRGYISREAQLYGVETRTSCPIRITRNTETYQSLTHPGLYPTGEGAGYAGGITSAACDGVRVADAIFKGL